MLGVCSKCMRESGGRPWQYALALFDYRGVGRDTVRAFKFYDRPELARSFAELAVPVLRECGEPVDLLIPVPLHWTRAWRRGYNQAALFAGECARQLGVESLPLLRRTRPTPHQAGGSREARLKNLQGAFAVRHPERLRGRSVWLVDDVLTTGSTLTAAAQALSKAGVREMRILVIARA